MFKEIKNFIKKTVHDPNQKTGQFGGTGSHIDDTKLESEPNGYNANANVLNVHPDGGENIDRNAKTTMKDVQDFHTNAVFDLLGQPQVARPSKDAHRNIDQELKNQYFSNLEQR